MLDEISWLASKDHDFPGKLKGIWDTKFKKNSELILILCGSVSSWIQANILEDKGFMGRVSLSIELNELSLSDANQFWRSTPTVSAYEKLKILCVTGGIPRYLEEIQSKQTAEENHHRLCFTPGGVLFEEFDKIFKDIFEDQALSYRKIIEQLVDGSLEPKELCEHLGVKSTGGLSKKLKILKDAGLIARDYVFSGNRPSKKLSRYRLKDNYIRFYLKYIQPKRELVKSGMFEGLHLEDLPEWPILMGLQFENLVLNQLPAIQKRLNISPMHILSASPYFQHATKREKACQIDLLIQTRYTIYLCEIKYQREIESGVIEEVLQKIARLKLSPTISVRPVLIYAGSLSPKVKESDFFHHIISFEDFLI